eukprot:4077851-Heterocapsa_arctica.AAC.1
MFVKLAEASAIAKGEFKHSWGTADGQLWWCLAIGVNQCCWQATQETHLVSNLPPRSSMK